MKKFMMVMAVIGLAGIVVAASVSFGFGKTVTATPVSQQVSGFTANLVSVYNATGTTAAIVYALVNCSTSEFNTAVSAGTAVPIPVAQAFTFDTRGKGIIDRICFGSATGTNTAYMGAY